MSRNCCVSIPMSNLKQIKPTSHHTLSICNMSSHHILPKSPLEEEDYNANRDVTVHLLTYALWILNKEHIYLLKPLAFISCARLFPKARRSSTARAEICERKG